MRPFHVFTLLGVPVYVDPWYLLLLLIMVRTVDGVAEAVIWGLCVTFSILVHEAGHAIVARYFKLGPAIVLHGWGGRTMHEPARKDGHDALIVAAGPGAGLLLGGLVLVVSVALTLAAPELLEARPLLATAITVLLYTNIFWSLLNLVPMYPLDGGRLFRLGAHKVLSTNAAMYATHGLGFALAVLWGVLGWFALSSIFMAIIGAMFAIQNAMILLGNAPPPDVRVAPPKPAEVLGPMRKAWADGDAREAVRLAHVTRSRTMTEEAAAELYTMLVVGNVAMGEHAEALEWVRYAPRSARVVEGQLRALLALGRVDAARALLDAEGNRLSAAVREEFAASLAVT